ncbi:bifunctional diguanylate cyclase/phosphodiesterase [Rhodobacteraceae bacterium RKSG542]|uniref:putative bifunctional diguanylate cyclase/phosphodiesterase n=1 Tax=Pseudovibrio flavus TaxID=2529854 RepID=UPI0012BC55CD|nr:bifunctional diguanylate cyclase/phosphodiesterase [Pseudovibrio flavus]MTI19342.1 bifunctional diguanylate cyclase/phosphodiesterase [Pseudovibrio flavus]
MPTFLETIYGNPSMEVSAAVSKDVQESRKRSARAIALFLLLIVCFAFGTGFFVLDWATKQAVINEAAKERRLVTSNLTVYRDSLANELERLAVSNRAYDVVTSDKDIIYLDQDLSPTASNRGDRDVFVILDADRKVLQTYRQDLPWHSDVYKDELREHLAPLLDLLESEAKSQFNRPRIPGPLISRPPLTLSAHDMVAQDGGISLATVAAIIPADSSVKAENRLGGYLVWLRALDSRALKGFERSTGLKDMYIAPRKKRNDPGVVAVPLITYSGEITGYLHWSTAAVSKSILPTVAPYFIGASLAILLITMGLLRHSIRLTDKIVRNEAAATYAALHDPLSGLPNRTYFANKASFVLKKAWGHDKKCALIFLDLDHFKQINDSLGHPIGDKVIQEVARRIHNVVKKTDIAARISGDEFLILLSGRNNESEILASCRAIETSLMEPMKIDRHKILTTISMGVSISPEHGTDLNELLRKADIALYEAKRNGRGCYLIFRPAMEENIIIRRELEVEIERALARNEFQNYYQPILDRNGEEVIGVEALIRWNHPKQGLLSPAMFLPVAEESQLIVKVGEWVLENAIKDATTLPGIKFSINVSPVQLRQRDFPALVSGLLESYGVSPDRIEMEVTEEVLMNSGDGATDVLERLSELGISIALDDFGTGYSSMSYLRQYKFNKIKIDRSFVQDLDTDEDARVIVTSLINLSQSIGMQVCVEGVETEEQHEFIKETSCEMVQGYLFSKPIPLTKFKMWKDDHYELLARRAQIAALAE